MSASGQYGKGRLCAGIVGHADLRLGDGVARVLESAGTNFAGRWRRAPRYGRARWNIVTRRQKT